MSLSVGNLAAIGTAAAGVYGLISGDTQSATNVAGFLSPFAGVTTGPNLPSPGVTTGPNLPPATSSPAPSPAPAASSTSSWKKYLVPGLLIGGGAIVLLKVLK